MEVFLSYFNQYGIYLIMLFIILEYSCFPLPSEVILPAAGAYAAINNLNVFLIILLSTLCGLIGSVICYIIGIGGRNVIIKRIIRKQSNELNNSIISYNKYKNLSICIGRVIPLCRTYISFVAGLNKHNFFSYILFTSIGVFIWNLILILLGYNLFYNLDIIESYYNNYKYIILIIGIVLIIILIVKRLIKKIKSGKIYNGDKCETKCKN